MGAYVINTIRDGKVANTWATSDVQKAMAHANQCVTDYVGEDALRGGLSVPSQIIVTHVGEDYNEKLFEWLPEDLEITE